MKRFAFPMLVVALVLGGVVLVVQSSTTGGVYDMTIGELLAQSDTLEGKDVRVNGVVQAGTFREVPGDSIDIRFSIGDIEGNQLQVRFHQLLPDAFQEGRQVIVQGTMLSEDEIECKRLTVKCPSKYKDEAKTDEAKWKEYKEHQKNQLLQGPQPSVPAADIPAEK